MTNQSKLILSIIFIAIGFIAFNLYLSISLNREQTLELKRIKSLGEAQITSVRIEQDPSSSKTFKTLIIEVREIEAIKNSLKSADVTPVAGHVLTVYECILVVTLLDGEEVKLLARVYDDNTSDLYVSLNLGKIREKTYFRQGTKPIRIPGLGQWIMGKEPQGKL